MKPIKVLNNANEYKQYKQLVEFLRSAFFSRSKCVFKFFRTKKVYSLSFLIFKSVACNIPLALSCFSSRFY